jgi:hypothetical protein
LKGDKGTAEIASLAIKLLQHVFLKRLGIFSRPFSHIRTTMNVYGDVVTDEMEQAHSKVVCMALATVN